MKIYKDTIYISLIFVILFLITDFIYSNFVIKGSEQKQKKVRVFNEYYHHGFKKKISNKISWGGNYYNICTDHNSFLISCKKKGDFRLDNYYDILFIGDSFTEGVGYPFEETFVGIYSDTSNQEVANLGVLSYSPFLYYHKIKYILSKGVSFKHLVVFIDLSDIEDDLNYLNLSNSLIYNQSSNKIFYKETNEKVLNPIINFLNFNELNIKNILARNFIISYNTYKSFQKIYFNKIIKDKNRYIERIGWMKYDFKRVSWSYDDNFYGYTKKGIKKEIDNSVLNMKYLYELLKKNNIELSIAVYPWPQSLLYEKKNSRYINTWKEFCKNKCKNFLNLFPIFHNNDNFINNYLKFYIYNDVHFNDVSHKLIGDYLRKNLIE